MIRRQFHVNCRGSNNDRGCFSVQFITFVHVNDRKIGLLTLLTSNQADEALPWISTHILQFSLQSLTILEDDNESYHMEARTWACTTHQADFYKYSVSMADLSCLLMPFKFPDEIHNIFYHLHIINSILSILSERMQGGLTQFLSSNISQGHGNEND